MTSEKRRFCAIRPTPQFGEGLFQWSPRRPIASNGVAMTKVCVLRSRVRSKDSRTVLRATKHVTVMLEWRRKKVVNSASRDRGVPQRPGGQLGGRGTRRNNSSEARGDKRQRAAPHPDPEAAGLNSGMATRGSSVQCVRSVNTLRTDEDGVSRGVARFKNRPSQRANRPDRSC
jgi:hypothetical protein